MLTPILLIGHGRSGTRAMMSLLGTDPTVTFERAADFQIRQLTYLAKLSILVDRRALEPQFSEYQMRELDDSVFGPPPWEPGGYLQAPEAMDLFPHLWEVASRKISRSPGVRFYAEKSPPWVSTFIEPWVTPFNICVFRDPRDVFISAMAYMRKRRDMVGFGRLLNDPDDVFIRVLCYRWINFYEHWFMTGSGPRTMMVRYEDFAASPERVARIINERSGLNVDPAAIEQGAHHRTASTTASSIERHRSEPLSADLATLFTEHLGEEINFLDYGPVSGPRFKRIHFKDLPAVSTSDGNITPASDRAIVEITGPDFWFYVPVDPFNAADVRVLWLAVCAPLGDHCSVYWRRQDEFFSEERSLHLRYFPGRHWRVFEFDLTGHPLWAGTIVELRLDLFNFFGPVIPGSGEATWLRLIANT